MLTKHITCIKINNRYTFIIFLILYINVFHNYELIAHVAQSAERHLGKVEVTGSIPVMGSKLVYGLQHARVSLLMKLYINKGRN